MPIRSDGKRYFLEGNQTAYVLAVRNDKLVEHLYWGPKLPLDTDYPQADRNPSFAFENPQGLIPLEYPAWGGLRFSEPCLKVEFSNGCRDTRLVFEEAAILPRDEAGQPHLVIRLADTAYPLRVELHYRLYEALDIVERWAVVSNVATAESAGSAGTALEPGVIRLEQVFSACWHLPAGTPYCLTHLAGRWGGETQLRHDLLSEGKKVLESRRGATSHQANPWSALTPAGAAVGIDLAAAGTPVPPWPELGRPTGEEDGAVWYGALAWSGNWKIVVETTPYAQTQVLTGINDFDTVITLMPGEKFTTPACVAGYTEGGFGSMSRTLHRYQLRHVLPPASARQLRPVLYNSWEATHFAVNEQQQMKLADKAAQLGVELFVVDDGWFGRRQNDRAGLGDWYVNPEKFPRGLGPLIDHVHRLGMKFGLWVEPEMVNPDSDLYRQHPDWVLHFPARPRTESRYQLVLNLARPDVRQFILDFMDRLLSENPIDFIKWDMNRHLSEPGWPDEPPEHQREIWIRYGEGLYQVWDELRARHPKVLWESCSGGGGRVDLGILRRADQVWTSDNTDPFDRLFIQEGYSYAYSPKAMVSWVTDSPHWGNQRASSLRYRFHVAMSGTLGIGANLNHWSPAEMEEARALVAQYKAIRHLVQEGNLYRLISPRAGELAALQYVNEDAKEAVLFVYLHSRKRLWPVPPIHLRGLSPERVYSLETEEGRLQGPRRISGRALMACGLSLNLQGDFDSVMVRLKAE